MRFCPGEKCEHYSKATKYPRQCYYEPQCWRGELDLIIATLRIRLKRGNRKNDSSKLPEFREYAYRKYPNELDENLITMIEDLIEHQRTKRSKTHLDKE